MGNSKTSLGADLAHSGINLSSLFSSGCALAAYYIQGFDISFRQGENFLVVTHKSILRALICTALGLPPERQVRPAFLSLQFRTLCAASAVENRDLYIAICQQSLFFSFPQMASKQCRFRAIDVNNGGMCVFTVNKQGEAMLQALNMTAHMYSDHTYQY